MHDVGVAVAFDFSETTEAGDTLILGVEGFNGDNVTGIGVRLGFR